MATNKRIRRSDGPERARDSQADREQGPADHLHTPRPRLSDQSEKRGRTAERQSCAQEEAESPIVQGSRSFRIIVAIRPLPGGGAGEPAVSMSPANTEKLRMAISAVADRNFFIG